MAMAYFLGGAHSGQVSPVGQSCEKKAATFPPSGLRLRRVSWLRTSLPNCFFMIKTSWTEIKTQDHFDCSEKPESVLKEEKFRM
jgi:hypothetical protein